jgi:O-antigen ligase
VSIATRGQNSAGALYGYLEMTAVAIIALVVVQARPQMHLPLLMCAAIGALLGSLDALAFGHSLAVLQGESQRLSGHYNNPNLLGFAGSLAVPVFLTLAILSRPWRAIWALMGVVTLLAVCLSYSRAAILGTCVGVIASISLTRSNLRRRLQVGVAGCLLFALVATVAYPVYEQLRTKADFGRSIEANAPDRSGWDSSAQGLIGSGPSRLSNPDRQTLSITARADAGASIPLGEARLGHHYLLKFLASSPIRGVELAYGLEDNLLGDGPATRAVLLTPAPKPFLVTWTPTHDAPHAQAYIWLPFGGKVTLSRLGFGQATETRLGPLPTQLLGRANTFATSESHFVHSREDAAHLAFDLFVQKPLTGIGWQQFTSYSATRLSYGPLASHNEYLRYAAELGLPGLLFLFLVIATVVTSAMRIPPTDVRVAAAACMISAAVGLFFVNALETPNISLPLFLSAALICTGSFAQRV